MVSDSLLCFVTFDDLRCLNGIDLRGSIASNESTDDGFDTAISFTADSEAARIRKTWRVEHCQSGHSSQ